MLAKNCRRPRMVRDSNQGPRARADQIRVTESVPLRASLTVRAAAQLGRDSECHCQDVPMRLVVCSLLISAPAAATDHARMHSHEFDLS